MGVGGHFQGAGEHLQGQGDGSRGKVAIRRGVFQEQAGFAGVESRELAVGDAQEPGILGGDGPAGEFLVVGEAPGLGASKVEGCRQGKLDHGVGGEVGGVASQGGLSAIGGQGRAGGVLAGGVPGREDSAAYEAGAPSRPEVGVFGGTEAGEEVRGAVVVGIHAIFAGVVGLQEHSAFGEGSRESAGLGGGV